MAHCIAKGRFGRVSPKIPAGNRRGFLLLRLCGIWVPGFSWGIQHGMAVGWVACGRADAGSIRVWMGVFGGIWPEGIWRLSCCRVASLSV